MASNVNNSRQRVVVRSFDEIVATRGQENNLRAPSTQIVPSSNHSANATNTTLATKATNTQGFVTSHLSTGLLSHANDVENRTIVNRELVDLADQMRFNNELRKKELEKFSMQLSQLTDGTTNLVIKLLEKSLIQDQNLTQEDSDNSMVIQTLVRNQIQLLNDASKALDLTEKSVREGKFQMSEGVIDQVFKKRMKDVQFVASSLQELFKADNHDLRLEVEQREMIQKQENAAFENMLKTYQVVGNQEFEVAKQVHAQTIEQQQQQISSQNSEAQRALDKADHEHRRTLEALKAFDESKLNEQKQKDETGIAHHKIASETFTKVAPAILNPSCIVM